MRRLPLCVHAGLASIKREKGIDEFFGDSKLSVLLHNRRINMSKSILIFKHSLTTGYTTTNDSCSMPRISFQPSLRLYSFMALQTVANKALSTNDRSESGNLLSLEFGRPCACGCKVFTCSAEAKVLPWLYILAAQLIQSYF